MKVGERDNMGRLLKLIIGTMVLVRSRQTNSVAICDSDDCNWMLTSKNAMGVGSRHAAAYAHRVVVTREVITEYDAETPTKYSNVGT